MSNFTIFHPATGQKLAEGMGLVFPAEQLNAQDNLNVRDKFKVPEIQFNVVISHAHWRRIRRMVKGSKPRLPRKIKKAMKQPCARSKWLHRSVSFSERTWKRYLDQPMQLGQCHTLQARLYHYLMLTGCKYWTEHKKLKCVMPSGAKLCIFDTPKKAYGPGTLTVSIYGIIDYPYRHYRPWVWLDDKGAAYLYRRLGEEIKQKVEQLNK